MKKHYPKKINFTLAAFAMCLTLFLGAPSTSSIGGAPVVGGYALDKTHGIYADVVYSVQNGNGAYIMIAYFGPESYTLDKGKYTVYASFDTPYTPTALQRYANLVVFKNGSAILQCAYTRN